MKFLVIGCNGMAGHIITLYLKEKGHSVIGFARSKSPFVKTVLGDVFDTLLIKRTVTEGSFDTIINSVGILNQEAENDKASAAYVNAFFPHYLAKITENTTAQIIHMSTDCVFSGKIGNYTEESFKDGESFYDRSKALGELNDNKNLTLRNSIVGPDMKMNGIGLLNWFMLQKSEVNGYTKSLWTGQTTLQLAKTMEIAAKERVSGLINMVPPRNISKYELLRLFNRYIRHNELNINPVDGVVSDKTLVRTNFSFSYEMPDYETMIIELAEWMNCHKNLYPHYKL